MGIVLISMLLKLINDPKYNKRTNGKKWTKVPIIPQITGDNEYISPHITSWQTFELKKLK